VSAIAAAILAAGGGTRLGGDVPKPLLPFAGRPLVEHALAAALGSGLAPVLLVVGDRAGLVAAAAPPAVEVVHNEAWTSGIASSLRALLRALEPGPTEAVVVGLADQPLVGAAAFRRVAAAYDAGARLAAATYGGVRGNPVMIAREHWPEAAGLSGDEGARVLLRTHPVAEVPCDDTGDPTDIDTASDLAALESRWRSTTRSE
jgi:CTP:molybdopterin cytidylyltransferase MocA